MNDYSWVKDMKSKVMSKDFSEPFIKEVFATETRGKEPVFGIVYIKVSRRYYWTEYGNKDGDIIFHFFPTTGINYPSSVATGKPFEEVMSDAFLEVFKFEDKLQAVYTEELLSWAVKVVGYGDNSSAHELCTKVIEVIDRRLEM